jgi:SpoVK/Ycf46/Vps4 family AAA+-type ATPase
VLVDEAENVLADRYQLFNSSAESMDKGWINEFMERPDTRVLWIVNYPGRIDQTIRRRFSFSLHFAPLGVKERRKLWKNILGRHGVEESTLGNEFEPLIKEHHVPAAVIDMAVQQAGNMDPQHIGKNISLAVKTYELLQDGGKKRLRKSRAFHNFTLDGVTADLDIRKFIEKLQLIDSARQKDVLSPGFGTMLFYGPAGTGKTALAHYIADTLGKECLTRRASDILNCYVGETEQNIVRAFREAEEDDAVLLIDEADSFIYSRDIASRSWESTLVNEFLTALEECQCFLIATSNRREAMDYAAMRRFSFKVPFRYAGPKEIQALYQSLLAPLAESPTTDAFMDRLAGTGKLAPGDFHAVRLKHLVNIGVKPDHEELFKDLLLERDLKLERDNRQIGF